MTRSNRELTGLKFEIRRSLNGLLLLQVLVLVYWRTLVSIRFSEPEIIDDLFGHVDGEHLTNSTTDGRWESDGGVYIDRLQLHICILLPHLAYA